ncbi:unnamed protein product [Protopolystoma xenopodis]|uniref:Uncharacterized protein n=1 Tax=Protopolystoma xenopodis TaxID=117903 RepID=A0A448X1U2_9PLAT|nr:unnamed protein product [Protopolystoma xenopodis]
MIVRILYYNLFTLIPYQLPPEEHLENEKIDFKDGPDSDIDGCNFFDLSILGKRSSGVGAETPAKMEDRNVIEFSGDTFPSIQGKYVRQGSSSPTIYSPVSYYLPKLSEHVRSTTDLVGSPVHKASPLRDQLEMGASMLSPHASMITSSDSFHLLDSPTLAVPSLCQNPRLDSIEKSPLLNGLIQGGEHLF